MAQADSKLIQMRFMNRSHRSLVALKSAFQTLIDLRDWGVANGIQAKATAWPKEADGTLVGTSLKMADLSDFQNLVDALEDLRDGDAVTTRNYGNIVQSLIEKTNDKHLGVD